jgi:hypothetical protein
VYSCDVVSNVFSAVVLRVASRASDAGVGYAVSSVFMLAKPTDLTIVMVISRGLMLRYHVLGNGKTSWCWLVLVDGFSGF